MKQRPEIASIATLVSQLEISRRALITSRFHSRRILGIEGRAFCLQLELEYLLSELFEELDANQT
jgi:hypothetical protein